MGQAVVQLLATDYRDHCTLCATASRSQGGLEGLAEADIVVDFSLPAGTAQLTSWLQSIDTISPILVCGTTGLSGAQLQALRQLGERRRVLHANNFSSGIAALSAMLEFAAPMLESLGYTPVISEAHHAGKRDAPSGTAKTLQETLKPGAPDSIQTHSLRAGSVIGEHEVRFFGPDDEIAMSHTANHRTLFARGAVDAALWLHSECPEPGFLTMREYFAARYLS